jgi:hypothetical protein
MPCGSRLTYRLNSFSSKISQQNIHFNIYTETSKRQEGSLCKNSHPKCFKTTKTVFSPPRAAGRSERLSSLVDFLKKYSWRQKNYYSNRCILLERMSFFRYHGLHSPPRFYRLLFRVKSRKFGKCSLLWNISLKTVAFIHGKGPLLLLDKIL